MAGGHAWQGEACMAGGGMHGRGACVAGGIHGRGRHAWQGACMAKGVHGRGGREGGHVPRQILRDTVNEQNFHKFPFNIISNHMLVYIVTLTFKRFGNMATLVPKAESLLVSTGNIVNWNRLKKKIIQSATEEVCTFYF